jgi:hypothetical protein
MDRTDWYSWRVENWGTKWDCDTNYIDENNGQSLSVGYITAWAPNENFIKFPESSLSIS